MGSTKGLVGRFGAFGPGQAVGKSGEVMGRVSEPHYAGQSTTTRATCAGQSTATHAALGPAYGSAKWCVDGGEG